MYLVSLPTQGRALVDMSLEVETKCSGSGHIVSVLLSCRQSSTLDFFPRSSRSSSSMRSTHFAELMKCPGQPCSGDHSRWNGLKAPKKAAERLAVSQPRHRRSAPPKLKRLTDRLLMQQANFPTAIHHSEHHSPTSTLLFPLLLDTPFQHCDHERPYRRDQAFPGPEARNVSPLPNADPPFTARDGNHMDAIGRIGSSMAFIHHWVTLSTCCFSINTNTTLLYSSQHLLTRPPSQLRSSQEGQGLPAAQLL